MEKNIKLALLGGDARQGYLASFLAERGFETAVWGLGDLDIGDAVRCREIACALSDASAVILPLPASADGVHVNCPYCNDEERIKLSRLLDITKAPIFGGKFEETFIKNAHLKNRRIIDYFESESLQIRNAAPTAEGAVAISMQHLKKTIRGCRTAVVGYGRIGQMLSHLLEKMGASVTVAARNYRQLAQASSFGCDTVRLSSELELGGLAPLCEKGSFDVIFNTVPARLFDSKVLSKIPHSVILIDLSSVPGGVDFGAAKDMGIKAIWALSLPGKYAPESAGRIIGDTLLEYFEGEGLI